MTDFVEYHPRAPGEVRDGAPSTVLVRAATADDLDGLAIVMSARGGTVRQHLAGAQTLVDKLPVLLVAETDHALVGWSGAQRVPLRAGEDPEWLIAGLVVVPEHRRKGIAARLLGEVVQLVRETDPDGGVFSIINARNRASIDLHRRAGFGEVDRGPSFAGVEFTGGEGVLLLR